MTMYVVPVAERYTDNFTGGRWSYRNIVIHATRGKAADLQVEYANTVAYFLGADRPSAHFVVGPTEVTRMVRDGDRAWHAEEVNHYSLGIEIAQPETQPPFVDFQYRATAALCRNWCELYGIPKVRVMSQYQRGIIGHEDSEQGKRWGKSDPGPMWNWDYFMKLVNDTGGVGGSDEDWQNVIDVTNGWSQQMQEASRQLADVRDILTRLRG